MTRRPDPARCLRTGPPIQLFKQVRNATGPVGQLFGLVRIATEPVSQPFGLVRIATAPVGQLFRLVRISTGPVSRLFGLVRSATAPVSEPTFRVGTNCYRTGEPTFRVSTNCYRTGGPDFQGSRAKNLGSQAVVVPQYVLWSFRVPLRNRKGQGGNAWVLKPVTCTAGPGQVQLLWGLQPHRACPAVTGSHWNPAGRGSHLFIHSSGGGPAARTTTPHAMAQVVSLSPSPATVAQNASSKLSR